MENDGLPEQVCLQCTHDIIRSFSFKQLCERSDGTLRQILGHSTESYVELKPYSHDSLDMEICDQKDYESLELKIESVDIEIPSMSILFLVIIFGIQLLIKAIPAVRMS